MSHLLRGSKGGRKKPSRLSMSVVSVGQANHVEDLPLTEEHQEDLVWLRETCEFYEEKNKTDPTPRIANTIEELKQLADKANSPDEAIRSAALRHLHLVRNVGIFDMEDTPSRLKSPRGLRRGSSQKNLRYGGHNRIRSVAVPEEGGSSSSSSGGAGSLPGSSSDVNTLQVPGKKGGSHKGLGAAAAGEYSPSPMLNRKRGPRASVLLKRKFAGKSASPQETSHIASEKFDEAKWMRPCEVVGSNTRLDTSQGPSASLVIPSDKFTVCGGGPSGTLADQQSLTLEDIEGMKFFYNNYFLDRPHSLYLGRTERGDPLCIAVEVPASGDGYNDREKYRVLILTRQGYIKWWIPSSVSSRERLKLLKQHEALTDATLRKSTKLLQLATQLMIFEKKRIVHHFKFGVVYRRKGQMEENAIFSNQHGSPQFYEFMNSFSSIIKLKGYKGYRGGLDTKEDLTGAKSFFQRGVFDGDGCLLDVKPQDEVPFGCIPFEAMFHVAPFLPWDPTNAQQIHKKRHIGNDIVVVVFSEGKKPLDPTVFTSNYNHVYIIVRPVPDDPTGRKKRTGYRVCTCSVRGVKPFRPYIPADGIVPIEGFGTWLLLKMMNAEIAAMYAPEFRKKAERTIYQVAGSLVDEY